ncbi:MAG TPA: hypothetical protein VMJ10_35040 [Kofleriaceae bacterium]|nr:hypothetical protein [Kofleriaceae bacterium]
MTRASIFLAVSLAFAAACGNSSSAPKDAGGDAAVTDGGGVDASCFTNPQTHYEIINACTTAQKIYKDSHPPLLNPDGTLPPLP